MRKLKEKEYIKAIGN